MENKNKILLILLAAAIIAIAFFLAAPAFNPAKTPAPGLSGPNSSEVYAVYFYGDGCTHCEKVKPVIADLKNRYPDLNITELEIYYHNDNAQQMLAMSRSHGIETPGVPVVFIRTTVLYGEVEITNRFENEILAEKQRIASWNATAPGNATPAGPASATSTPALSLPLVIGAALVDSTNPCGLSVLVFLLISMAAAGGRKRILMVGGAYIAAMFLFHLLVGIGLFSVFSLSGLAKIFSLIGGAVALVLGIITLADVLRNKETFLLSIPESRKGLLGDLSRKASLPAAFILGILAGILGFSCTGGIYISILGLMGRDMSHHGRAALPHPLQPRLYPALVILTLLVAYGVSPERADTLKTRYKRSLRLVIGIILIALGLIILLGWLG